MKTNLKQQDYHKYIWKRGERFGTVVMCTCIVAAGAYFFYRSVWAMIPLSIVGVFCYRMCERQKTLKQRMQLAEQFRECILAVATALQAGYSIENAFLECAQDMELMFGSRSVICQELVCIRRGLRINLSLEELLLDFAKRSGCNEVEQFAKVFALAKRNGGNMAEIIRNAAMRIGKKIEIQKEVEIQLSGRRMELRVMKWIPFGILIYINISNPGYFDSLYHNFGGVALMTCCLLAYLAAVLLGEWILDGIMTK